VTQAYALDASAMVAYTNAEPGGEIIESLFLEFEYPPAEDQVVIKYGQRR
jgi:hypothetical protein